MKKNKMMRIASVLLVAVILTTCAISGTYAKYVTSADNNDSARVAKFGVKVTATASTFAKEYTTDDGNVVNTIAKSVVSTEDVVAPGTSGNMAAFTITGTPEVAVRVAFTGTLELGDQWVDSDSHYYCPIEITVGDTPFKGTAYASADLFEAAVNEKIATYSKNYAAGTNLNGIGGDAPVITWSWPFEVAEIAVNDKKDTYLGDRAAEGNAATISLSVTATVTQVD